MTFEVTLPLTTAIPYLIGFIVLLIGSYTDFKTREVPDWINFGLVGVGFGVNLLFSVIYWKINFILASIIGFVVFFVLAWFMFYFGQWGGGDSKMLMGLGALFGIDVFSRNLFLVHFLVNVLLVGALYGILWSIMLILKNRKKYVKSFKSLMKSKKIALMKKIVLILFIILLLLGIIILDPFIRIALMYSSIVIVLTFYLWIAIKAVEKSCMLKYVKPQQLTEGDWIARDIVLNKKIFLRKKMISNNDINKLKKFYYGINKKIRIKRKYFFFIELTKTIDLSRISKGDIVKQSLKINGFTLRKNQKITKKLYEKIKVYIRKNDMLDVKIRRKILFFWISKTIHPIKLKKSDFLLQDIMQGHIVSGPQDLGIEKYQIELLKSLYAAGKVKKILIKEGVPFVPSFFIAYIITLVYGNLMSL
jgi:prepilin signal peptidase PulO-like enzyme (type II secretory pathway)